MTAEDRLRLCAALQTLLPADRSEWWRYPTSQAIGADAYAARMADYRQRQKRAALFTRLDDRYLVAESRTRLSEEDRETLLDAIMAHVPEEWRPAPGGRWEGVWNREHTSQWAPYLELAKRLEAPAPGGRDYRHLHVRRAGAERRPVNGIGIQAVLRDIERD